MLVFRQLFDLTSSTYSYLLGDPASGDALLIDPVFENAGRDAALVRELARELAAAGAAPAFCLSRDQRAALAAGADESQFVLIDLPE